MTKIVHKSEFVLMKNIMENMLETHGYETIKVETDEELLEALEKEEIDFVIYDLGKSYAPSIFDTIKKYHRILKQPFQQAWNILAFTLSFTKEGCIHFLKSLLTVGNLWRFLTIIYLEHEKKFLLWFKKSGLGRLNIEGEVKTTRNCSSNITVAISLFILLGMNVKFKVL